MNNYAENKKKIEAIRNKVGEPMFRMAISHLIDVGGRHLTEETVKETCKKIMQEDDSKAFMTNEFKCELIRASYELAQISQIDLLVYIQREVYYDVFDGIIGYNRAIELLKKCMYHISASEFDDYAETLNIFQGIGFTDDELEGFNFGYLFDTEEEN